VPTPEPTFYSLALSKYPEADRGKCLSCGFLAEAVDASTDVEVRVAVREMGMHFDSGNPVRPFCFQNAQPIFAEYNKVLADAPADTTGNFLARNLAAKAAVEVIAKDRKCAEWYPYSAGASPLWHREEMRMMHLEELRRQNDLKIAELQAEDAKRGQEIAASLKATAEATGKFTTKWTYIAVLLAFLAVLGVFLAWLFPNPLTQPATNRPAITATASPTP
jgi:hypothetical protein